MSACNFCGYKAEYIKEYTNQEDISECLCGACLNKMTKEQMREELIELDVAIEELQRKRDELEDKYYSHADES